MQQESFNYCMLEKLDSINAQKYGGWVKYSFFKPISFHDHISATPMVQTTGEEKRLNLWG